MLLYHIHRKFGNTYELENDRNEYFLKSIHM